MAIEEERFRFAGADGAEIQGYRWRAGAAPKAALVVAHGAAEHALRYKEPLTPLIEAGYVTLRIIAATASRRSKRNAANSMRKP